jgi:PAS domain S-box-containing protein
MTVTRPARSDPRRSSQVGIATTLLFLAALGVAYADEQSRPRSVLLLFSLRSTAASVGPLESAFRETLEKSFEGPVDFHVEYLDLPDASNVPYGQRLTDLLREKYAGRPIDVVVAARMETLRYLLQNREALFPGVPVVFTDISRQDFGKGPLPADTTGAFLSMEGQKTVDVALDLHPEAQRIVFVGGASPSDRGAEAFARRLVEKHAPGFEVVSLVGLPLDVQLDRLANLPEKSVVLFLSYRADAKGRSMIARDVLRRLARVSRGPIYGASETFLGLGIAGGDLIRYGPIGEKAGELAARILRGEAASTIPPVEQSSSRLMFDWRELKRWKIDEGKLPPGSAVLYREKTLWTEYKWHLLGLLALILVQWAVIGALVRARRRRRQAEADLRAAEERYRTVADFTQDWEYWKRPDGEFAYVSPSCLRTTGYAAEEFYRRPALPNELVVEEDRESWETHRLEARAGRAPQGLEFRIRTKNGQIRWIEHLCTKVTGGQGEFLGVRGSNRDVSRRKQSEAELRRALSEIGQLRERLEADNTYLREQLQPEQGFEGIVGSSDAMRYVLSKAQQVAPTSSTVLLLGETGVGKDLVARAIHGLSPRRERPLVKLNCAALPPSLVESELFGHEKGAFTGAVALRRGRFEIADGSTLFLDEIGELPMDLQAKLLHVIQDGEFERVGGTTTLKTDVRLIAATNRHLDEDVKNGRFRADLWYRLNVFPITVPPLRQRREDIPQLVAFFVEKHSRKTGKAPVEVSQGLMKELQSQNWPGNVRELESVVERAVISSPGPSLRLSRDSQPERTEAAPEAAGSDGARTLTRLERDHIVSTLEQSFWRLEGEGGAAERLGINPSTLRSRMRKHGIRRPGSRPFAETLGRQR